MTDPIGDKHQVNFLQVLADLGYKPSEPKSREALKKETIAKLSPYFTDKRILEEIAETALSSNRIQFEAISKIPWALELFERALKSHNLAKSADWKRSVEIVNEWLPTIYQRALFSWSWRHSYADLTVEILPDFVKDCMEAIGDMTEGLINPLSKELLHQLRLEKGNNRVFEEANRLKFGEVVNQIQQLTDYGDFLAPKPWKITISQWRNIADHRSFALKDGKIVCTYGESVQHQIELTTDELREVVESILYVMIALHLAHRIFYLDNIFEKLVMGIPAPDVEIASRAKRVNFSAIVAPLGFDLINFKDQQDHVLAVVQDMTDQDPAVREFQIVSLAQALWQLTHSNIVEIHYIERDGVPRVGVRTKGELFNKLSLGKINEAELFEGSDFLRLKPNL